VHILLVVTLAEHGGAQSHVATLADGLAHAGDTVTVASGEGEYLPRVLAAQGHRYQLWPELVSPISLSGDLRAVKQITRRLRQLRPDVVHAHSSKAGLLVRFAASRAGIPCVFTAHGWGYRGITGLKRHLILTGDRLAGTLGHRVIAVSEYDRQDGLRHGLAHHERIVTIPNGIPDLGRALAPVPAGPLGWVMVARMAPPKRPDLLMQAWAQLPEAGPLTLVGDGPDRAKWEALAGSLGLAGRVHFWGACDDVPMCLDQAAGFLLASDFEGFPISILEAMRAARAVVASAVGGVPEAVVPGLTGELVSEPSVAAWVAALRPLLQDRDRVAMLGEAGRVRYLANFTAEAMTNRVQTVYRSVVRR